MRILAFTDTHVKKKALPGLLKKANDADLLIGGGDFSDWGEDTESILAKFNKINKPLLVIHGNHEDKEMMYKIEEKYNNIIFLHKKSYQIGKYVFFGYGGGGFSQKDKNFERVSQKFLKSLKKGDIVVMLSHGPPHGTKLDNLEGMGYTGCKSFTDFIKKNEPVLWICGHIHENFGEMEVIGRTVVVNPGPDGKMIEV
jgi:hypothetical protein